MKDEKAQKRLQPHKGNIGVENRIASPEPACKAPHQQKGLKANAAPPDSLAEHFPPAQILEGRVGEILTWVRGEERRAPSPPLSFVLSGYAKPGQWSWRWLRIAAVGSQCIDRGGGRRRPTQPAALERYRIPQIRKSRYSSEQND